MTVNRRALQAVPDDSKTRPLYMAISDLVLYSPHRS
jgi:hypothetical protein